MVSKKTYFLYYIKMVALKIVNTKETQYIDEAERKNGANVKEKQNWEVPIKV